MDSDDEEVIHHFSHEHPLCRNQEVVEWSEYCSGCHKFFLSQGVGEAIYGCKHDDCSSIGYYLHQECAEMPRRIRHAAHPSHQLTQSAEYTRSYVVGPSILSCAVCEGPKYGLMYTCSSEEGGCAMVWIHLGCAGGSEPPPAAAETMHHPSHPRHELRLQRRRKDSCSFHCDACGTVEKGNFYSCSICNYWIHQSCADLPEIKDFPLHHPNHSLSLSYYLPYEYSRYEYTCAICDGALRLRPWVYHCRLCRYVVHLKCATNTKINNENIAADDDGKAGIMKLPINDVYEEMIKPFVKKCNLFDEDKNMNFASGQQHKFHNHHHPLNFATLELSASSHDNDHGDDDDDDPRLASVITCDGCILPIHQKSAAGGYMYCGECDYFLHLACFNLPPELISSHPLHSKKDHMLTLLQKFNSKLVTNWSTCDACGYSTNGLFYSCNECDFILDIKCASLPDAMKHAGHARPRHFLKLVAGSHEPSSCGACCGYIYRDKIYYRCDRCRFSLCLRCALLPASNKHGLEKHRMPLTYDASINHPGDFYCGSCERRMHPRTWMYHCRHCEESFHPRCFHGGYKNINFGSRQHYYVDVTTSHHQPHHPLKLQIITTKNRCDLCRRAYMYEKPGYQCADCNFVSCMDEHPNVSITPSSSTQNNSQFLLL